MVYKCIKCDVEWGEGEPEKEGYSHGVCCKCLREKLIPIYRRRQCAEGNPDCFGKSVGYCDQSCCCYRYVCLCA
jgi:hypothetical protein